MVLADAHDVDRSLLQVFGALCRSHHDGGPAIGDQAAVQQMQRLRHVARRLVIGDGQRFAFVCVGILGRPASSRDGHVAELLAGGAELDHVTLGDHRVARGSAEHTVGDVAAPRSAVRARRTGERVVAVRAHRGLDQPCLDGHHRVLDQADVGGARLVDGGGDLGLNSESLGHLVRPQALEAGRRVLAEHRVDVLLLQSRVVHRELCGLDGEGQRRHARHLPELGRCRADDAVLVFQAHDVTSRHVLRILRDDGRAVQWGVVSRNQRFIIWTAVARHSHPEE